MAQYVYDMSKQLDVDKLDMEILQLANIISSKKFKSYIADKCLALLKEICDDATFWEEHSVWASKLDEYRNGHKVEIGNDYVLVFNNTQYSQDELWWLSDKTKENYQDGLSVAYLIEYGMGVNSAGADDWETSSKSKWVGYNPDDYPRAKFYQSREGKLIYLKLSLGVEERIEDWISEYIGKETRL